MGRERKYPLKNQQGRHRHLFLVLLPRCLFTGEKYYDPGKNKNRGKGEIIVWMNTIKPIPKAIF